MTKEEASRRSERDILARALRVAEFWSLKPEDKIRLRQVTGFSWNPLLDISQAMHIASLLNMSIIFGDNVVLVSEPNGAQSRTEAYEITGRVAAMQRAITLLAADCAEQI